MSTFTRRFVYKSVGFLCKLPDPFLEQEIDHTDGGYEHISRITFKAHWATDNWRLHDANDAMDQLGETGKKYWELYLTALETAGYLSSEPIRELYHRAENGIPLVCTCGGFSWRLANWLEKKRQPATYEHSYASATTFSWSTSRQSISRPATSTSRCNRAVFIFGQTGR